VTLIYSKHILFLAILFVVFTFILLINNKRKIETIRRRWNLRPTGKYRISIVLYFLFWSLIFVSLLDFRGSEVSIKANKPISKTLILIDVSTSMFAEDVKPNRLKKAVMLARHFVKNHGIGDIGVLIFSDTTKKLVPFTDDRDLLDSRLGALEDLKYEDAGSNLPMAISESLSYLASESDKNGAVGNIMVISDAETHEDFNIVGSSERVKMAFVAVGTSKGANIPIRDRNNVFRGYKEYEGKAVITKINENFLKTLSNKFSMYKYWVIYSYSLPTDEILNFMSTDSSQDEDGLIKQRPVLGHLFIASSIFLYFLYTLLRSGKSFYLASILSLILLGSENLKANEIQTDLSKLGSGNSTADEKGNLIASLLKEKKNKEAGILAGEIGSKKIQLETKLNIATAQLANNKTADAIEKFEDALNSNIDEKYKNEIRENLLISLNKQLDQKGKSQKQDQKKSEEKNQSEDQGQGKGSQGNQEQQQKDKKNQNDQKDKNKEEDKDKSDKSKDQEKEDSSKKQQPLTNKDQTNKSKKSKSQLAGLLEQLKSDDKQLQKQFIDTSAKERGTKGKDW